MATRPHAALEELTRRMAEESAAEAPHIRMKNALVSMPAHQRAAAVQFLAHVGVLDAAQRET